jgi:hypothetical protein
VHRRARGGPRGRGGSRGRRGGRPEGDDERERRRPEPIGEKTRVSDG